MKILKKSHVYTMDFGQTNIMQRVDEINKSIKFIFFFGHLSQGDKLHHLNVKYL